MERIPYRRRRLLAATALGLLTAAPLAAADIVIVAPDARSATEQAGADLAAARNARDFADASDRVRLTAEVRSADLARDAALRQASEDAVRAAARRAARPKPKPLPTAVIAADRVNPYLNTPGLQRSAEYRQPVEVASLSISSGLAAELDSYLSTKGSPLAGYGQVFVTEAQRVQMDPRLLVAITGAETAFGTYGPSQAIHNPFGLGPGINYGDWQGAIAAAVRTLGGSLYKGSGHVTIGTIQPVWAPGAAANDPNGLNLNWQANVSKFYTELGGNPAASVFADASAPTGITSSAVQAVTAGTVAQSVATGVAVPVVGGGSGVGPSAANDAIGFMGLAYIWGGATPAGFDCSGLVQYVYGKRGVVLPRVAEDQAKVGIPVAPQDLQAGDALFFADPTGYIHHEGLYLGGGMFIHSPHTGDVIKISSLYEDYYATQYAGARRY